MEDCILITAKVVAHSVCENRFHDREIVTWEVAYPRIIHSELMTHRVFSRNAASSRAIPFAKMAEQLKGRPIEFGRNQPGMQAAGAHDVLIRIDDYEWIGKALAEDGTEQLDIFRKQLYDFTPEEAWEGAMTDALKWSKGFAESGYHKQVFNRLTEPFQMMKTVITSTEISNYMWLRDHEDADPTIAMLSQQMKQALILSNPVTLKPGQWHLPYVDQRFVDGNQIFFDGETLLSQEYAIKMSVARCAAVSFRNVDYPMSKCLEVYERLVGADRKHASALEHQATPIKPAGHYKSENLGQMIMENNSYIPYTWEEGVTHVDRQGNLWSGNFKGWRQYRKTLPGENHEN